MTLIIRDKSSDVTEWAAKYVIKRINSFNPGPNRMFVLGLPTGGTPLGMYQKLVQAHKAGKISFKYVITFNMDEYVGIAEDHPESYPPGGGNLIWKLLLPSYHTFPFICACMLHKSLMIRFIGLKCQ